jgi:hypothetical protein
VGYRRCWRWGIALFWKMKVKLFSIGGKNRSVSNGYAHENVWMKCSAV